MKNNKCLECHEKFHACDSCGLSTNWKYEFCSHDCYIKYNKSKINEIKIFLNSFNEHQLYRLKYYIFENNYELFKEILKDYNHID